MRCHIPPSEHRLLHNKRDDELETIGRLIKWVLDDKHDMLKVSSVERLDSAQKGVEARIFNVKFVIDGPLSWDLIPTHDPVGVWVANPYHGSVGYVRCRMTGHNIRESRQVNEIRSLGSSKRYEIAPGPTSRTMGCDVELEIIRYSKSNLFGLEIPISGYKTPMQEVLNNAFVV